MVQMHEQKEKKTLEEMHRAACEGRPKRWTSTKEDWFDGEWYDDDADCICD